MNRCNYAAPPKSKKDTTIVSGLESEDSSDEIQAEIEPEEVKKSGISPLASARVIKTVMRVNGQGLNGYGHPSCKLTSKGA
jgi:hypothetical protein